MNNIVAMSEELHRTRILDINLFDDVDKFIEREGIEVYIAFYTIGRIVDRLCIQNHETFSLNTQVALYS